jgi:hypothetical protein
MNVLQALAGGDLGSIGASNAVVERVLRRPALLRELLRGLSFSALADAPSPRCVGT